MNTPSPFFNILMFLALLLLSVSGTIFQSFDPTLDPADLFWPNAWVPAPVLLSSNHAGSSSTVTVNFQSQVVIPKGSYYSISIKGFSAAITGTTGTDLPANTANVLTTASMTLTTTSGSYGPVSITFSQGSSTGQVIASAASFGFIGIVAAAPTALTTLSVTYASSASTTVSASTSLLFSFPLTANLNQYDYFVLSSPSLYPFTTLSAPSWTTTATGYSYFNTTGYDYSASGNTLTVYGVQAAFSTDVSVSFTVTGYTNPNYVTTGSGVTWTATLYRFGTNTILQQFTGTGPSATTMAGSVTFTSWAPSNGYITASQVVSGVITYMTLKFSCQHAVPAGGSITVTFSSGVSLTGTGYINSAGTQIVSNLATNYGLVSPSSSFTTSSPALTTTTAILTVGTTALAAGTGITLYNLVTFSGSSAAISSIISKDSSSNTYDSSSTLNTLTYPAATAVTLISGTPSVYFTTTVGLGASIWTCSSSATGGLTVDFVADVGLSSGQTVTVNLPIANQASASDFVAGVGTTIWGQYPTTVISSAVSTYASSTTLSPVPVVSTNSVLITLGVAYSINNHVSVLVGTGGTPGTLGTIYMPNWSTSMYNRHEASIQYTASSIVHLYTQPFFFVNSASVDLQLQPFCSDTALPGMLAQLTVTPPGTYTAPSGYTTYIDFKIVSGDSSVTAGLSSALTSGSTYPSSGLAAGSALTIKYTTAETTAYTSHLIVTAASWSSSAVVTFLFPFPALTTGNIYTVTSSIVTTYTDGSTYYMTSSNAAAYAFVTPADVTPTVITTLTATAQSSSSLTLTWASAKAVTTSSAVGLVFDFGYSASSPVLTATAAFTLNTPYSSTNALFPYLTLYAPNGVTSSSTLTWTLTGLTVTWVSGTSHLYAFGFIAGSGSAFAQAAAACSVNGKATVTVSAMTLTYTSGYTPATIKALGADSLTTTITGTFTLPGVIHGLPNSSITVTLDSNFQAVSGSSAWSITIGTYTNSGTSFTSNAFTPTATTAFTSDIASGTTIVIKVTGVPVPSVTTTTGYHGFTSVKVQYSSADVYSWVAATNDDTAPYSTGTLVTTATAAGAGGISLVNLFPNTLGATSVYLQIQFKPQYALPAGTVVTISGNSFSTDSLLYGNLWCSVGYTSASITSSSLVLTLGSAVSAGSLVEIRKDEAFSISSSATSPGPAFLIGAVYGSTIIISDTSAAATTAAKPVYAAAPSPTVTSATLTVNQTNYGVVSTHNFVFKLSADTTASYMYAFDVDGNYDAHFGGDFTFTEAPSVYYHYAYSAAAGGDVLCMVDHWILTCDSVGVVKAGSPIDFALTAVNAPVASVSWNLYVVTMTSTATTSVVVPYYGITATFTSIPALNVDLYYVSHAAAAATSYTLTFQALISETYAAGSAIFIEFPHEFNLDIDNAGGVDCGAVYNAATANTFVASGTSCALVNGAVEFPISAATTLTNSYWSTFTLSKVVGAPAGKTRTTGYDALKSAQFTVYNYWTNSFAIFTTNTSPATAFSSMSAMNVGAAYTGFMNPSLLSLSINSGNSILIAPGTFSAPVTISAGASLVAVMIAITATDQNDEVLAFDSPGYALFEFAPQDFFRVGAATGTLPGFYFITWAITEKPLVSGTDMYIAPRKSLVQVYDNSVVSITIGTISNVPIGGVSLPILLAIAGGVSPFSDVSVTFATTTANSAVTFYPSKYEFSSLENMGAFAIGYNGTATAGSSISFTYTLSGTDMSAFSISSGGSFTLGAITTAAPSISAFLLTIESQTSATVSLTLETASVVTWAFGSTFMFEVYPVLASYEGIAYFAYPIIGTATENQTMIQQQIMGYQNVLNSIDPVELGWEVYSVELLVVAQLSYFAGQVYLPAGTSTLYSFNNLIASVYYSAVAYADNYSGQTPALNYATEMTTAIATSCVLTSTFADTIAASDIDSINNAIAKTLNIFPGRVINFKGISRRRLSSNLGSIIQGDVRSSITPLSLGTSLSSLSATLLANIVANGVSVASVSTSAREVATNDFPVPTFTYFAATTDVNGVEANFTTSNDGVVCCEGEYNPNTTEALSSYDVWLQLDRAGQTPPLHWCWAVTAGTNYSEYYNFTANEITNYGTYIFTCTDCNQYPIWPVCLNDTDLQVINFTWTNITAAAHFVIAAVLAYLI